MHNSRLRNSAWGDTLAIVILILLHPVVYHLDESLGYFPPDAVQYMTFAKNFLSKGLLYLEFGLSDSGTVLPPMYPLLLLIGSIFVDDLLVISELVSSIVVITSSIVFYFIIQKFSNQCFAVLAVLGIQLNHILNLWALTPLTEATFILVIASVLWLTFYLLPTDRRMRSFVALGVLLAVAFLTRQIGIVLAPFALLIIFLASPRKFIRRATAVVGGMMLLLAPYMITLHAQGSLLQVELSAFEQHWSKRNIISIDEVDTEVKDYLHSLNDIPEGSYEDVYEKRRLLRQLLPDSSAMLSDVSMKPPGNSTRGLMATLIQVWTSLDQFGERLVKNIQYLANSLGLFVCVAFLISLITPIFIRAKEKPLLVRYLISGFVLYYLFTLSLLTGLVDRYVLILAPFVLLHISAETACLLISVRQKVGGSRVALVLFAAAIAAYAYSQPKNFSDIQSRPKGGLSSIAESKFRQFIEPGEPIFSMTPLYAYYTGGSWRIMPNDSLEKIAEYARHEHVLWLVVTSKPGSDIGSYEKAQQWYLDPNIQQKYQHLIELKAVSRDGQSLLFRFRKY